LDGDLYCVAARQSVFETINTPIDSGKVEAQFENGVVQIVLPKAEAVKPKQIKVNTTKTAQPNGNK
jgi:HSP20 family protein